MKGWAESCTFLNWSAAHSNASNVGLGSLFSIGVVDHKLDGVDGLGWVGEFGWLLIVCYNHSADSLHYAILISWTGLVIFFSIYLI